LGHPALTPHLLDLHVEVDCFLVLLVQDLPGVTGQGLAFKMGILMLEFEFTDYMVAI
jgi:hypothetical protein